MSGKGTEEALWESEEMFRSLVQSSYDVINILDAYGTTIYDGPAVERVLGYKPEERIDTNIFEEAHADNLERGTRAFGEVLAALGGILPWSCHGRTKTDPYHVARRFPPDRPGDGP